MGRKHEVQCVHTWTNGSAPAHPVSVPHECVNEGNLEPSWRMRTLGPPPRRVINRLLTFVRRPSAAVFLGIRRCSSRRSDETGAEIHLGIRFHSMLPGNGEFLNFQKSHKSVTMSFCHLRVNCMMSKLNWYVLLEIQKPGKNGQAKKSCSCGGGATEDAILFADTNLCQPIFHVIGFSAKISAKVGGVEKTLGYPGGETSFIPS